MSVHQVHLFSRGSRSVYLRVAVVASLCIFGCPAFGASPASTSGDSVRNSAADKAAAGDAFDPRAIRLLAEMVDAYRKLPALDQETVFEQAESVAAPNGDGTVASPKAPPQTSDTEQGVEREKVTVTLQFDRPNHLSIEMKSPGPVGQPASSLRWICDGKFFWSYDSDAHTYTQEDAPAHIRDFDRLHHFRAVNLELSMLMGIDPFAGLKDQMDSVHDEGAVSVQSVQTEVVALRSTSDTQVSVTRLYIGLQDHLLHRLAHEATTRLPRTDPIAVGDPLDGLLRPTAPVPGTNGSAPADAPQITKVVYDNVLKTPPTFTPLTFHYTPPAGSTRLTANSEPLLPLVKGKSLKDTLADLRHKKKHRPRVLHY